MGNRRPVIIILSDSDTGVESMAVKLEENYNVYQVSEVDDVKDLLAERPVDIIIINFDRNIEEKFGLISFIKGDKKYYSILVGTITQGYGSDLSDRAIALGSNYNFRHPINASRIKKQIDNDFVAFLDDTISLRDGHFDRITMAVKMLWAMNMGYLSLYYEDELFTEYIGENALRLLGYDDSNGPARIRRKVRDLIHPSDYDDFFDVLTSIVDSETGHHLLLRVKTKKWDYQRFEVNVRGFEVWDGVKHFSLVIRRIDNEETMGEDLRAEIAIYQENAKLDLLTGIYNKQTFFLEGTRILEANPGTSFVVTVWDIDRFKAINEMFGTRTGDRLIIEFADFLKKRLYADDCLYGRIESDRFISMAPLRFHERNEDVIRKAASGEIVWHSLDYRIYLHVGCYKLEPQDDDIAIACDRATMAMQSVKYSYLNRLAYFTREMRDSLLNEQEIIRNAESAILDEEFFVMFQPIVDSHTREIVSAEALIRWKKKDGGYISPGIFVPTFEKNGFISKIDHFVWEQVCRFQAERRDAGQKTVPISVNLSRTDFYNENLFEELQSIIKKYDIAPSLVKIEVTESAYMDQPEIIMKMVERFRECGHQILMDDFGSGFSSFNMLKDFALDVLKIDMRFMESIDTSERAGNILYSIIQMAKAIRMQIVAEGVETDSQYEMLKNMDCDCIQGYYFYKPLMKQDFAAKLEAGTTELSASNINIYDRILLITEDQDKVSGLLAVMDDQVDIHAESSAAAAGEYLQRYFSSIDLILMDFETLAQECESFIGQKEAKTYYSDIPVVLIAGMDTIGDAEHFIGNGVVDSIRTPFEKNVVRQRLRRIIDFYGIQAERRTINVLKKSMLLRQQLNSFFEDSIAGIARVILDKNDDHIIKEISYVNERFLKLHGLSLESAMKADTLEALLPNILYLEVDSFSEAVYAAIEEKSQYVSREYMLEMKDGSVKSCTAACSLLYLGDDVKMDLVLLESTNGAEERAVGLISAIYAHANYKKTMRIFRYYIDEDILDRYRKREDGRYTRELLYNARENLLAGFGISKGSRTFYEMEEMLESLKNGAKDVEKNILMSLKGDGKKSKSWYRVSFTMLKSPGSKRCALCILEDLAREDDYDHLIWTNDIYNRVMNENSVFYLEADLTDNRILNSEAFEILKPYGLPELCTYDEFIKVFDMTVSEEHLNEVRERVDRQNLINGYEEGIDEIRFKFVSKTLEIPRWMEYEALILLQKNIESGHLAIGMRLTNTENGIIKG